MSAAFISRTVSNINKILRSNSISAAVSSDNVPVAVDEG
jgi:hypothetical protein